MFFVPIWEHARLAQRHWRLAPNAWSLRLRSRCKLISINGRKNRSKWRMREKWISFWRLWRKDLVEQWRGSTRRIKLNGVPKKTISSMRKGMFTLCILGKATMKRIHKTKIHKEVGKDYLMMRDQNSCNNSRRTPKVWTVNRKTHRKRKKQKAAKVKVKLKVKLKVKVSQKSIL